MWRHVWRRKASMAGWRQLSLSNESGVTYRRRHRRGVEVINENPGVSEKINIVKMAIEANGQYRKQ